MLVTGLRIAIMLVFKGSHSPASPVFVLLAGLVCLLFSIVGEAQSSADSSDFHWAYAATFGTGIYKLGDETEVLVARLPISWTLREAGERDSRPSGVRLLFPLTLGVKKFDLDDILGGTYPSRAEQVSFLPGVEYHFIKSDRWAMKLRAQVGWGTQVGSGDDKAWIYALGFRTRYAWPEAAGRPAWISGVLWSGYDPKFGSSESLARLTNGVEFDISVSKWHFRGARMHLLPHILGDWYFNTADFFSFDENVLKQLDWEWEIGLSAGRDKPFSVFRREIERFGVALRFSKDSTGIRFFVNSLF